MTYTIHHVSQDGSDKRELVGSFTWDEMVAENGDDHTFMERLAAMKAGETITEGGGAAALINVVASNGCHGSIQWGIDNRRGFDIKGLWKYGREITNADSHEHALNLVLSWDCDWNDEAFTYIAPKELSVYRVGPRWDYMRSDEQHFVVRQGKAVAA